MVTNDAVRTPPGPALAPMAQALKWIGRPYEFARECAREFGDVFSLQLGANLRYVVFSHPDAIRAIFLADSATLQVGAGNGVLEPFLGPGSLLLLEGERHLRERRLILPAFHNKVVSGYAQIVRDALLAATRDWSAGREFVAQEVLQGVSIDVILRAVFGLHAGPACSDFRRELLAFLNDRRFNLGLLGQLNESRPHEWLQSFQQQFSRIRELTRTIVSDRRAGLRSDEGDMLSILLDARDEDGRGRSDDDLRDELLTLVATGYETTATALAWGLYWIAQKAQIRERLREEAKSLGRDPDPKAYAQLEYLDATCKEILRIYPIVPSVFRQVGQPFSVAGYTFEPGTVLSPSIYLTHHRFDIYENPDVFDPERFLRKNYTPYEYLPFGGGARRCIGMPLALHEMRIVLAAILEHYELDLVPGQQVIPARRSVTVGPSSGPRMVVKHVFA